MDDIRGVDRITKMLHDLQRAVPQAAHNALVRAAGWVHKAAVQNAPISPRQEQLDKSLSVWKVSRRKGAGGAALLMRKGGDGKVRYRKRGRKADAVRAMPGGLEQSIGFSASGLEAKVFVAANSPAGKYAAYIHDRRHQKPGWENLGIGSSNKRPEHPGREVGGKFIKRAIRDNQDNITKIIQDEMGKAVPK